MRRGEVGFECDGPRQILLDALRVNFGLLEERVRREVVGDGQVRVGGDGALVEGDGLGVLPALGVGRAEVGERGRGSAVEFDGALERLLRLLVLAVALLGDAEREPEARRVGELLERLLQAYDGGGWRFRVVEEHPVAQAVEFVVRVARNGESHRGYGVLDVAAGLVHVGERGIDGRGVEAARDSRFERAARGADVFAFEVSASERDDRRRV